MKKLIVATLVALAALSCTNNNVTSPSTSVSADSSWQSVADANGSSVYMVGVLVVDASGYPMAMFEIGTAFKLKNSGYFTNAHVALALDKIAAEWVYNGFDSTYTSLPVIVKNGEDIGLARVITAYSIHPDYDTTVFSADIARLYLDTSEAKTVGLTMGSTAEVTSLTFGQEIGSIGFPGELAGVNYVFPKATMKTGLFGSAHQFKFPYSPDTLAYFLEYSIDLTPGTSGSPLFNAAGHVIGIHNSGTGSGSNCSGIRGDLIAGIDTTKKVTMSQIVGNEDDFLVTEGVSAGNFVIGQKLTTVDPTYKGGADTVVGYTDNVMTLVQAQLKSGKIYAVKISRAGYGGFEPPFHTKSGISVTSSLSDLFNDYNSSDIAIVQSIVPLIGSSPASNDTVSISTVDKKGIAFTHSGNSVDEIMIYPPDSVLDYTVFSRFQQKNYKRPAGVPIVMLPNVFLK